MKVGDLFSKPKPDVLALPPVPSRFPPCCHETVREVQTEWQGKVYTVDQLEMEVLRRREAVRRKMQPVPSL